MNIDIKESNFPDGKLEIDNTKRDCFTLCPRKYYWQYIRHLRPDRGSTALRYGSVIHDMLECHYKGGTSDEVQATKNESWARNSKGANFVDDFRSKETLDIGFEGYLKTYADEMSYMQVLEAESSFCVPVHGVASGIEVNFIGRKDLFVEIHGNKWIMEHKTTSRSIGQTENSLYRSAQTLGYTWAALQEGLDITGCMINILKMSAYYSKKQGRYTSISPDYKRVPLIYTEGDLENWLESFKYTCGLILQCMSDGQWPMQFDGCYKWGTCPFTGLCEQVHPDVSTVSTEGYHEWVWDPRN